MESRGAMAGAQCQPYEAGELIRLVGVRRVRLRMVGRSAWGTGQVVLSIAALYTSCTYRLQRRPWSLALEPTVAPYLNEACS